MLVDMHGVLKESEDVNRAFFTYSIFFLRYFHIFSQASCIKSLSTFLSIGVGKIHSDWPTGGVLADRPARSSIRILVSILRRDELKSNPALFESEGITNLSFCCCFEILLSYFSRNSDFLNLPFFIIFQRTNHGLCRPNTHNYCVERGCVITSYSFFAVVETNLAMCFQRDGRFTGKRSDYLEYQCLRCSTVDHQKHSWSVWR